MKHQNKIIQKIKTILSIFCIGYAFLTIIFCKTEEEKMQKKAQMPIDVPTHIFTDISMAEESRGKMGWIQSNTMKCRDGSNTGFGVRLSKDVNSDNLLIYMQAGGVCFNLPTCAQSDHKYTVEKFGNENFERGIFSNRSENPFQDWNIIFVPYCTGDMHIGNVSVPSTLLTSTFTNTSNEVYKNISALVDIFRFATTGNRYIYQGVPLGNRLEKEFQELYHSISTGTSEFLDSLYSRTNTISARYDAGLFVGFQNMQIVTQKAVEYFQPKGVKKVVVTGSSAGGFGTYINYNSIAEAFGDQVDTTAIVDAAPIIDNSSVGADCGYQSIEKLWNITLPADFDMYVNSNDYTQHKITGIYKYLSKKYGDKQFGLIADTKDYSTRLFYTALAISGRVGEEDNTEITCSVDDLEKSLHDLGINVNGSLAVDHRDGVKIYTGGMNTPPSNTSKGNPAQLVSIPTAGTDVHFQDNLLIGASTYETSLVNLKNKFDNEFTNSNWKTFYNSHSGQTPHVFLIVDRFYDTNSSAGVTLAEWVNDVITNSSTHQISTSY